MIYVDSKIFIYGIVNTAAKGNSCREFLKKVQEGRVTACTSVLTFDEVFWHLKKILGFEKTLIAIENFLTFPNLKFLDVTAVTIVEAFSLIKKYKVQPRDAIHAACALIENVHEIISEDSDFDIVVELKRKTVEGKKQANGKKK